MTTIPELEAQAETLLAELRDKRAAKLSGETDLQKRVRLSDKIGSLRREIAKVESQPAR